VTYHELKASAASAAAHGRDQLAAELSALADNTAGRAPHCPRCGSVVVVHARHLLHTSAHEGRCALCGWSQ
jgi:predicted RNA-binding Zn-ribbon protein involved in translation (DUF1610 family)